MARSRRWGGPACPWVCCPRSRSRNTNWSCAPGDRLLVTSDGITECPDPLGRLLDSDGLARILRDLRGASGTTFLEGLLWQLGDYGGEEEFPDDISAVLLEYPQPAPG